MKKNLLAVLVGAVLGLTACNQNDAKVAAANLSTAADNFEINRRIVFYNTNTDSYALEITGRCSIDKGDSVENEITVTCKTGPSSYKKHFLAITDGLTFFAEQLDDAPANVYQYTMVFKPSTILPSVQVK